MEENHTVHTEKKSSNKALWITGIVIVIVVVGLLTNGFGLFGNDASDILQIEGSPVIGGTSAPVTIYEFSDFSCPYCAAAEGYNDPAQSELKRLSPGWEAPLPKIREEYVKTGKVKIVFKYYPGHGQGFAAHLVGLCLNDQGLFWEFHDKAFADYQNTFSFDKMRAIAQNISANMTRLNECLDSEKYNTQLLRETKMGKEAGIGGTPTFFVNGKKVEGPQSFSAFQKIIESYLK